MCEVFSDFEDADIFDFYTGSSHYLPSSHHHQLSRPSVHQRSMLNGNNLQQYQYSSHNLGTITRAHKQPMLRTHRITSGPRSHSYQQQKSPLRSVIASSFSKQEFQADEEDSEAEDEEEEEEVPGLILNGGSEEDEESDDEMSSDYEQFNGQIDGFQNNKRLKMEHYENNEDEGDKDDEDEDENEDDNDIDDPSEEMVVHVAPDEAILNAGATKGSPPSMLTPQTRMPSPLRIGDRLACPLKGCDRSYRHMKQYTSHQWTHRGIKPYICTFSDGPDESNRCQYMSEHPRYFYFFHPLYSDYNRYFFRNVIQHIRLLHFGIPRTIKEQRALVSLLMRSDMLAFLHHEFNDKLLIGLKSPQLIIELLCKMQNIVLKFIIPKLFLS